MIADSAREATAPGTRSALLCPRDPSLRRRRPLRLHLLTLPAVRRLDLRFGGRNDRGLGRRLGPRLPRRLRDARGPLRLLDLGRFGRPSLRLARRLDAGFIGPLPGAVAQARPPAVAQVVLPHAHSPTSITAIMPLSSCAMMWQW